MAQLSRLDDGIALKQTKQEQQKLVRQRQPAFFTFCLLGNSFPAPWRILSTEGPGERPSVLWAMTPGHGPDQAVSEMQSHGASPEAGLGREAPGRQLLLRAQ